VSENATPYGAAELAPRYFGTVETAQRTAGTIADRRSEAMVHWFEEAPGRAALCDLQSTDDGLSLTPRLLYYTIPNGALYCLPRIKNAFRSPERRSNEWHLVPKMKGSDQDCGKQRTDNPGSISFAAHRSSRLEKF